MSTEENKMETNRDRIEAVIGFMLSTPNGAEMLDTVAKGLALALKGSQYKIDGTSIAIPLMSMTREVRNNKTGGTIERKVSISVVASTGGERLSNDYDQANTSYVSRGGKFKDAFVLENDTDNVDEFYDDKEEAAETDNSNGGEV